MSRGHNLTLSSAAFPLLCVGPARYHRHHRRRRRCHDVSFVLRREAWHHSQRWLTTPAYTKPYQAGVCMPSAGKLGCGVSPAQDAWAYTTTTTTTTTSWSGWNYPSPDLCALWHPSLDTKPGWAVIGWDNAPTHPPQHPHLATLNTPPVLAAHATQLCCRENLSDSSVTFVASHHVTSLLAWQCAAAQEKERVWRCGSPAAPCWWCVGLVILSSCCGCCAVQTELGCKTKSDADSQHCGSLASELSW
ncbi:hypothetical protein O3P69_017650 [Scylla paramamosain]|uniref:Uncharacterized protein n=1 Tax=Scylla paramamosain TaxID=85552 RepID=A0AAW0TXM8_SCYPA